MTIEKIDIESTLTKVKLLLKEEVSLSPALKASVELLILVVSLLVNRLGINSKNSSLPPSQDPNRARSVKKEKEGEKRKVGGQPGHRGATLEKVEKPDRVEELEIDRRKIPRGCYIKTGYESRQVFDVEIGFCVTEYRAEVLEEETTGARYVAEFPEGITKACQYGNEVKAQSVYLSQFQLIPFGRVEDYFSDQVGLGLSTGSVLRFNQEAYARLAPFEGWARKKLLSSEVIHGDETSVNVGGKKIWLHNLSNDKVTLYHADNRAKEAMERMGVLPHYRGYLVHDHYKAYYCYKNCTHSLCNAHHLRELERAVQEDQQVWAQLMQDFLLNLNKVVEKAGGVLETKEQEEYRLKYREILNNGESECPKPPPKEAKQRGRQKKTKSRNLLERLKNFEEDVLRFMTAVIVPFTNNQGERDLRMIKVQQKISGCFRSLEGAQSFCRIRSFLSTCKKNNVSATDALRMLFKGKFPDFMTE